MNKRIIFLLLICSMLLSACGRQPAQPVANSPLPEETAPAVITTPEPKAEESIETVQTDTEEESEMKLLIGETEVAVQWEDNESVAALQELAADGPLTISMSTYGGFEQVGPVGASLPRSDVKIVTEAGDIVLYAGNQIVIFYGSNSWSYTRLGRITDHTLDLEKLLGNGDVEITLSIE